MNNIQVDPNRGGNEAIQLLRALLAKQVEQNALLTTLVHRQQSPNKQTAHWKKENPELSKRCGAVSKCAVELMNQLIEDLVDELETLSEKDEYQGNFALTEMVDKYGFKIQQLNTIMQTLGQLGTE